MKPRRKPSAMRLRSPLDFLLTQSQQVLAIFVVGIYFQFFIYRTERLLDSYLQHHTFLQQLRDSVGPSPEVRSRFLVFNTIGGQGMGNILHGLLAAHMLGAEFNRTVCVSADWTDFHNAFRTVRHSKECAEIDPVGKPQDSIVLLNFVPPPNECRLQSRLASAKPVMYIRGNTYPRWSLTPLGLWDKHYRPTQRLINALPYKARPSTVVHLRRPDNEFDERAGLDDETLLALAKTLPKDTFLVTNNVRWYTFFEAYGWKNPGWHKVRHSALEDVEWDSADRAENVNTTHDVMSGDAMQLWSDWYTILRADNVYHTHSDFSRSAIHWNEIDSKTIKGVYNSVLQLGEEPWRVEEPMPRLVDRRQADLMNCDKHEDDMVEIMPLDDDEYGADDRNPVEHQMPNNDTGLG
ncbi:hypothetical protein MHU86_16375 [Fragilaria crotonensis]|nr:hypothetical protein MHU86_16375 [Fragilaria crotonensis]